MSTPTTSSGRRAAWPDAPFDTGQGFHLAEIGPWDFLVGVQVLPYLRPSWPSSTSLQTCDDMVYE